MALTSITQIKSQRNRLFVQIKRILKGKGVKKYRKSLVFGRKIVRDVLRHHRKYVDVAVIFDGCSDVKGLEMEQHVPVVELSRSLFRELDIYGTNYPFLIISRPEIPQFESTAPLPKGCSLFVPFQNPENVGSVIRSAVAFSVSAVIILKESADPFHHKAIRASAGAVFDAPIYIGPSINDIGNIFGISREPKEQIFILHMNGDDIRNLTFHGESFGILPGIEGPGVPYTDLPYRTLKIPMYGPVESLNASVAVSIALYELSRHTLCPLRDNDNGNPSI